MQDAGRLVDYMQYNEALKNVPAKSLLSALGKQIDYHPKMAKAFGGVNAALFICELLFWRGKGGDPDDWVYKTNEAVTEETGMTKSEQLNAKRKLMSKGVLKVEKRGMPAKNHFLVNWERVLLLLLENDQWSQKATTSGTKRGRLDDAKGDDLLYKDLPQGVTTKNNIVVAVFEEINKLSGKKYRSNSKAVNMGLVARIKNGATLNDCLLVVRDRWERWKDNSEMRQYFNPVTLFRPSKFEVYLMEAQAPPDDPAEAARFKEFLQKYGNAKTNVR